MGLSRGPAHIFRIVGRTSSVPGALLGLSSDKVLWISEDEIEMKLSCRSGDGKLSRL